MLRFLLGHTRHRAARTLALSGAILLGAVSFVLLSSAAKTSELRVRGTVKSNFRSAYDILVRPRASFTNLERNESLVRDNYLSGIFGGITLHQYDEIRGLGGVEIAAPIANIGYVTPFADIPLPLDRLLTKQPVQLFRVTYSYRAVNGRSSTPGPTEYVYFTKRHPFYEAAELVGSSQLRVCDGLRLGRPVPRGPFVPFVFISCFSSRSPGQGTDADVQGRYAVGKVGSNANVRFPMLVAAIDPREEARLLDLPRTVSSGRYLRADDRTRIVRLNTGTPRWTVPVIESARTYVDEELDATVQRLSPSHFDSLPHTLASRTAYEFLRNLRGPVVMRRRLPAQAVYNRLVRSDNQLIGGFTAFFVPSQTRFRQSTQELRPVPVTNSPEIWRSPYYEFGYEPVGGANADVQFRRLTPHIASNLIGGTGAVFTPSFRVVGRYDPLRLPGFSPLSRVPLETYYPPELRPGDTASKEALGGKPLLPTENIGDYVQQPPLLLTTLKAMRPFLDRRFFAGTNGKAPISVVRVRVKGVRGPDSLSMARIKAVALAIRDRTGLDVDITAGSSPRELRVRLPAGKFGRPPLLLKEGWVKKGVSVAFLRAVDRKSLALFALILVICAFFLANGAFASARARRGEIGTLLCLGWGQGTIFRVLLGEIALIGALAGAVGVLLSLGIVLAFSLEVALARTLLVLPLAVALALVAGLVPAWLAARSVPLDAVRPVVAGGERRRRVHSLAALASVNLRRLPVRTAAGGLGLFVGAAALTLLLGIDRAFKGTLVDTLLGQAILVRIKGVDYLGVGLTIALAGLAVADVLFLNLRERAPELVTLRTSGWTDRQLQALIALEGLGLGLLGGLGGALTALVAGALLLQIPLAPLLLAGLTAATGAVLVALLASLAPLSQITRLTPPTVLAAE